MKNEEYEPFGAEWKNEVKKLDKNTLITMWRKSLLELRDVKICRDKDIQLLINSDMKQHDQLIERDEIIKDYNEQIEEMKGEFRFLCSNEHIEQDIYLARIEKIKTKYNL